MDTLNQLHILLQVQLICECEYIYLNKIKHFNRECFIEQCIKYSFSLNSLIMYKIRTNDFFFCLTITYVHNTIKFRLIKKDKTISPF